MSLWKRVFGRERKVRSDAFVCDFCGAGATGEKTQIALIKGTEAAAEFGATLKLGLVASPSFYDPKDSQPVWFACPACLSRYMEPKR